jgi:hypothetical protein
MATVSSTTTVRFRQHSAIAVAGLIATIGAVPLASVAWYFLPVAVIPLLVAVWAWRSGTDADSTGLRVRALLGQRRVPWSDIAELGGDGRGRAVALLRDGRQVPLPAVRADDLPRLVAASGKPISSR